jgi:hypothetical protein
MLAIARERYRKAKEAGDEKAMREWQAYGEDAKRYVRPDN